MQRERVPVFFSHSHSLYSRVNRREASPRRPTSTAARSREGYTYSRRLLLLARNAREQHAQTPSSSSLLLRAARARVYPREDRGSSSGGTQLSLSLSRSWHTYILSSAAVAAAALRRRRGCTRSYIALLLRGGGGSGSSSHIRRDRALVNVEARDRCTVYFFALRVLWHYITQRVRGRKNADIRRGGSASLGEHRLCVCMSDRNGLFLLAALLCICLCQYADHVVYICIFYGPESTCVLL